MELAFSGSREGMTLRQKTTFFSRLEEIAAPYGLENIQSFHHGVSGESDKIAHYAARALHFWIIGHPCDIEKYRFDCICDEWRPIKPPLDRNQDMVDELCLTPAGLLVATPNVDIRPKGRTGGTWSTIIRAKKADLPFEIIQLNGKIRYEI